MPIKVKDLIAQLQECNPSAMVVLADGRLASGDVELLDKYGTPHKGSAHDATYCRLPADAGDIRQARGLTDEQLLVALRNVGCDLANCDACAEVFFTGSKMRKHTCAAYRDKEDGVVVSVSSMAGD